MATWIVYENRRQNLSLVHVPTPGPRFDCGELRSDTPSQMILQWVFDQAQPGDLVRFPDGALFQISTHQAEA